MSEIDASRERPDLPWELVTERLALRGPDPSFAEALRAGIRDTFDELHRWMDWATEVPTLAQQHALIERHRTAFERGESISYYLFQLQDGAFVGASGYPRLDWETRRFEIGYWCHSGHQGKGYATEAVRALTTLAFSKLGARRVELRMSDQNERSWRVAERAGFQLEQTFPDPLPHPDGTPRRTRLYTRTG